MDDKYVIFKAEDYFDAERVEHDVPPTPIEGFVIRPTDVFGPATLWGYAHLLQTAVELGQMRPGVFTEDEYLHLVKAAEEVGAIAEDWQRRGENRKVPD